MQKAVKEMRANIDGATLAGLNNTQIVNAQNLAQAKTMILVFQILIK